LSTKKVNFDTQNNKSAIELDFVDQEQQSKRGSEMIDLRVHKKGLHFHGHDAKRIKKESEELQQQYEKHMRDEALKKKQTTLKIDDLS